MADTLTTTVSAQIPAVLKIHPAYGAPRDATPDDLAQMGYVNQSNLYRLLSSSLALAVTGDAGTDLTRGTTYELANALRYLIEVAVHYETTPEAVFHHTFDDEDPDDTTASATLAALRAALTTPDPEQAS